MYSIFTGIAIAFTSSVLYLYRYYCHDYYYQIPSKRPKSAQGPQCRGLAAGGGCEAARLGLQLRFVVAASSCGGFGAHDMVQV